MQNPAPAVSQSSLEATDPKTQPALPQRTAGSWLSVGGQPTGRRTPVPSRTAGQDFITPESMSLYLLLATCVDAPPPQTQSLQLSVPPTPPHTTPQGVLPERHQLVSSPATDGLGQQHTPEMGGFCPAPG